MEKDHPEIVDVHSPRNIVGLTHELDSVDVPENGHFEFGDNENPFSYYDEENQREEESSEEEASPNGRANTEKAEGSKEEGKKKDGPVIEVGENVSAKPPIKLAKSPRAKVKSPKAAFTSASALSALKDPEIDLSKFSLTPPPGKAGQKESA